MKEYKNSEMSEPDALFATDASNAIIKTLTKLEIEFLNQSMNILHQVETEKEKNIRSSINPLKTISGNVT